MKEKIPKYRKTMIKFLTCFFVVFPWITYLKVIEFSEAETYIFSSQSGLSVDFFLFSKQSVLIVVAIVALVFGIAEYVLSVKKDRNLPSQTEDNKWLFILSGIFVAFVLISTIFSEQKKTALWGSPTEGEGLWTLISYIILLFVFYNYFANDYGLTLIKKAIVIVSSITVVLSLVEVFYKPILEIDMIKNLVAPVEYQAFMQEVESSVFSNAIGLTFYNPGYFGGFVCLLLPFIVVMFLKEEKAINKVLLGVLCVGLMFSVIATNSTTALYLACLEILLAVGFVVWKAKSKKAVVLTSMISLIGLLFITVICGFIVGNDVIGVLQNENSSTGEVVEERFVIEDIILKDNTVTLVGEEVSLQIITNGEDLTFADAHRNEIPSAKDGGRYEIQKDGYENVDVYIAYSSSEEGEPAAKIFVDAHYYNTIDFLVLRDGTITGVGMLDTIVTDIDGNDVPEELKQYYGLFTGRGYAWINSMPILKETVFIGKGPGNFMYYFNQHDYMGLLSTHKDVKTLVDKPHSAYLQYAINLGFPAMLAFFGIIVVSICKAMKIWKEKKSTDVVDISLQVGCTVSAFGFLIYSIVNDSMVTVTPVLCMLVGILLATICRQRKL